MLPTILQSTQKLFIRTKYISHNLGSTLTSVQCEYLYLIVSRTGCCVLGLIPSRGAGGLRMMEGARVVRERLS